MSLKQTLREQGFESRRFEYEDHTEHVVDFGAGVNASVDVVDETAIVIFDGEQYDLDVPGNAQVFMNNGVLTIEVEE